jgi:acyl-CoA synthetase (NDP forming)
MGGTAGLWSGALAQIGAVSVQGLDEMMDTLVALRYLKKKGRRIAFLGGGGALGVFASDVAYRRGLDVPSFSPDTQIRLRKFFPTPGNSVANPLDTGSPALPLETILAIAGEILMREPIETLIITVLLRTIEVELPVFYEMNDQIPPPSGSFLGGLAEALSGLKSETGKDVVMVFDNRAYLPEHTRVEAVSRKMRQQFQAAGIPVFSSTERALRGIQRALELTAS